jgi:hypothetical protein
MKIIKKLLKKLADKELTKEIENLEKEVVFWKEKAMNFKRFHQ